MIHYHGGPITPNEAAIVAWTRRHACISFARPDQVAIAMEVAQSVFFDNGAFAKWRAGEGSIDQVAYLAWVDQWRRHPAFDWCVIPDIIDGDEQENNRIIDQWPLGPAISVPVWHMHETTEKLEWLVDEWPRVALGSSGDFSKIGTARWWNRMAAAMKAACDAEGRPKAKLHGLRMLNPTVFSQLPLSSADSSHVARSVGIDNKWSGSYQAMTPASRALILMERVELHAAAARWSGTKATQFNLELVG